MINVVNKIVNAWATLLHNNISVPVYVIDAPTTETGDYVLIRPESDGDQNTNNHHFVSNPVIITEVITRFQAMINYTRAGEIDNEIALLLTDRPGTHNLPSQDGISITIVRRQNATYLPEDDGVGRILRLITRNVHRVEQLTLI